MYEPSQILAALTGGKCQLIAAHTRGPDLGILGEARVNVLALNLALDVDLVKQLGGPSAYAARLTGGTPPPRSPPTS